MSSGPLLEPEEHVLSTLERDGSRRWLKPKLSHGKYLQARRVVAYLLIATYSLLPFIEVGGKPFVLFDLPARRFTIFGYTFLPTDTVLLALLMLGILLSVFLLTALFGRVWCGWACPQTVYMEFVFRPIERLFDRTSGRGGFPRRRPSGVAYAARILVYLAISFFLANTFLAYFVGVDELFEWMQQSPAEHPGHFIVMSAVTTLMMVDFVFFREQMCIIACPYGRLQSVLLDKDSLVVAYDGKRGEPRGKARHGQGKALPVVGDCVDCKLCVHTCPTGIDIREGLQMECINCTQCMDACDAVMTKLGRKTGLIRYSSQRADSGEPKRKLRPRVIAYPVILTIIAAIFVAVLLGKGGFDAVVLRNTGQPYTMAADGQVRNLLRLKVTNRGEDPSGYTVSVVDPPDVDLVMLDPIALTADETKTVNFAVLVDPEQFSQGQLAVTLLVRDVAGTAKTLNTTILGPAKGKTHDRKDR